MGYLFKVMNRYLGYSMTKRLDKDAVEKLIEGEGGGGSRRGIGGGGGGATAAVGAGGDGGFTRLEK